MLPTAEYKRALVLPTARPAVDNLESPATACFSRRKQQLVSSSKAKSSQWHPPTMWFDDSPPPSIPPEHCSLALSILLCLPTDHYLPTRIESESSSSSPSFDKNDHNTTAVTTVPQQQQQQQQNSPLPFYLIDTHPRPHWLFGSSTTTSSPQHQHQHSYALECASLSDLVACCHQLFPVVQLGSDVSELVAMMYNSFDLYTEQ